ncbi:MAG: archaellum component FlaF (FlaF/FlaG flagellin family) [Gammaproteobacteria bacterium]|jgi:archaellum component FlaF (FlaF/FlaG flagellin family)
MKASQCSSSIHPYLDWHIYLSSSDKTNNMTTRKFSTLLFFIAFCNLCIAQNVPILSYAVNNFGQVQLEIEAQADKYYLLTALHEPNLNYESITSITMGVDGPLMISEPAGAYQLQNYSITEHSIAIPDDTDGDGIDDITEFNNMPTDAPLNFAEPISIIDGTTSINDAATFASLAVIEDVPWAPFLNGQQFVKFGILDKGTDEPKVYFINSETHFIHANFFNAIGATVSGDDGSGEIVYNPNEILPNGAIGSYSFNFSFGDARTFESTQKTYELLVANMPFLQNNMQHFIGDGGEAIYEAQYEDDYVGSRINVVLESEVFADVDFLPFNKAEGFGFFRVMTLGENPGSRDIVLYDALPNSLPRVGGIITSVIQTPLSHVNLRAIQDNVPNAYIADPLLIDSIANLVGSYIYYRVEDDNYFIREATLEEVNDWFEDLRPTEEQIPERDLSITSILPLDSIAFEMSTAFGAKCANVATMRSFGFPEGTIPDGFGIPFYFYDEFMKFNGFYNDVEDMLADDNFINDLETRIDMLDDFRDEIKDADMPQWMLNELQIMHDAFPIGTSVRCRSSTNNEDLPGFSGAGLYSSKTQHPWEGHISKSVKQVYASMWNFRAYDAREFYRVNQYIAAMGILCHPNYQDEKSNGVGVSIDPIYQTENTFFLNTQVGESLITNPDPNAIPEEILLNQDSAEGYFVLRYSNLVGLNDLVMDEEYLQLMREYLGVIHDEFAILYGVVGAEGFGMDIEYKVTSADQLIIKQARPWVSFWADIKATFDLASVEIISPQSSSSLGNAELVTVNIGNQGLREMSNFDLSLLVDGLVVETLTIGDTLSAQSEAEYQFTIPQDFSTIGDYNIGFIVSHPSDGYSGNDTLNTVISNLHLLEGGIVITEGAVECGSNVVIEALVTNYGEATFNNTEIEIIVNGLAVDTVNYGFSIPYLVEVEITISVNENLQQNDNEIILNLLRVNGQTDAVVDNNNATFNTSLTNSTFDYVTVVINADDYPQETSWELRDEQTNELVASANLNDGDDIVTEEICVNYGTCLTLFVFDSYGDGICCGFGEGSIFVLSSSGDTLASNNGEFVDVTQETFCPNGEGCAITAQIATTNTTDIDATDGTIAINLTAGLFDPFQFSIDGGQTFVDNNTFANLSTGAYMIVIRDTLGLCSYEETVTLEFDIIDNVNDISLSDIKVFPNPTDGMLVIEIGETFTIAGDVEVEIYDCFGQLIQRSLISRFGEEAKAVISLEGVASGTYLVKCFNEIFEEYFRVVKI